MKGKFPLDLNLSRRTLAVLPHDCRCPDLFSDGFSWNHEKVQHRLEPKGKESTRWWVSIHDTLHALIK